MQNISYAKTFRQYWEVIALIALIAVVVSLVIGIIQPFKYRAASQLLIIQKQTANLDAYTATKSAEKIGKNLATIVYTSSFYNDVIDNTPEVKSHFPTGDAERRKSWEQNIEADMVGETGILKISAYDEDKIFASGLVRSIANTLVNKGGDYHGGGAGVEIKIVDDVFVSTYPVRPNLIMNTLVSLLLGIIVGMVTVVIKAARREQEAVENTITHATTQLGEAPEKGWLLVDESTEQDAQVSADQAGAVPLYNSIKTMHDHLAKPS